jgi:hypothetical protein
MVAGRAVTKGVGTGGVSGKHSADRASVAADGIDGEHATRLSEGLLNVGESDAGLDADEVLTDFEDAVEMAGEVEYDAGAE